jgi:hypothetical protein
MAHYILTDHGGAWPSGFWGSRLEDTLPNGCGSIAVALASVLYGALLLTTTSIRTIKNAKTTEKDPSTTSDPVYPKTTPSPKIPEPSTVSTIQDCPQIPTPTSAAPLTIGSSVVAVSYQQVTSGMFAPPVIVVGTQTVADIATPAATSGGNGIGSYIMSGLGGPNLVSASPAMQTANAAKRTRSGREFWWCSFVVVLLSLF